MFNAWWCSIHHLAVLVMTLFALSACADSDCEYCYKPPPLQPSQQALLQAKSWETPFSFVTVKEIDGKWRSLLTTDVILAPGQHKIRAEYERHRFFGESHTEANFAILVKGARKYRIRAGHDGHLVRIWVEDIDSKELAGMRSSVEPTSEPATEEPYTEPKTFE